MTSTPEPSVSRRRCSCSAGPTSDPSTESRVDLSLFAEDAAETLLPLAEERGVTSRRPATPPDRRSPALLQQMTTNLVHNAIVHNLRWGGTVWVTTSARSDSVVLTVENTGEHLGPQLVSSLD